MTQVDCVLVMTATDSEESAHTLADSSVHARLASSAQVAGPVLARYWWRGAVRTAQEWNVLFRTTRDAFDALSQHIKSTHPYELPEVIALPIIAGMPEYLTWISEETTPGR
jgi:periplasmic divalent cation tolerance protein